jgi:hypothetical protein
MGPLETISPGEEVSFTEEWYLIDYEYPEDKLADLSKLTKLIKEI